MNNETIAEKTIAEKISANLQDMIENNEDQEIKAELCFCKRYRSRNKTNYKFYRGNTNNNVAEELGSFLMGNIEDLISKQEVDESEDNLDENYVTIPDLNDLNSWSIFEDNAFNSSTQKLEDLKDLKRSLNSFIIYFKIDGKIIGQMRKLHSSKVLSTEGMMRLAFGNNVFNKLTDEDDVTIDKYYDFIFYVDENEKFGVINNYDAFCSIFDLNDQFYEEAKAVVSTSNIFDHFLDKDKIFDFIDKDRTLQRTLRNKVCSSAFQTVTKENIKKIKETLGEDVSFDVKEDFQIVLPQQSEKKALKEFIRCVGHYYNQSIYGDHIIEGRPMRYVGSEDT